LILRKISKFDATTADFKAKMHAIRFSLGVPLKTPPRELTALPQNLAVFTGPTLGRGKREEG